MSEVIMKKYILLLIASLSYADTVSVVLENDAIIGKDNHYTNGFYATWMSEDKPNFPDILSFIDLEQKNIAMSFSHAIFTPQNKRLATADLNDLPYAGYANLNFLTYKSSSNFFHEAGVNIGMVGPSTQADSLQKGFHSLIGHEKPKGWDTQLGDDFIYGASYNVGYKTDPLTLGELSLDVTTNLRADLGNFYRGGLAGANIRLSSIPLDSFSTEGNFIGANESLLINQRKTKSLQWAISFGLLYNKFDYFYVIDKAKDEGYNVSSIEYTFGQKLSFDLFYRSLKTSFYLKSLDINHDGGSSSNEKTGGISLSWKWN